MPRFFSDFEMQNELITTREDISRVSQRITTLPGFGTRFITFGSIVWGEHTWRSDIDVTNAIGANSSSGEINAVVREELNFTDSWHDSSFVQTLPGEEEKPSASTAYDLMSLSPSTRDHFRLLSRVKGGAWKDFFGYIQPVVFRSRNTDILKYAERMTHIYREGFPFTMQEKNWRAPHFDMFATIESFPKQLMRKILGKMKCLPCPDTFGNVSATFKTIQEPWVEPLWSLFQPFFEIDPLYTEVVAALRGSNFSQVEYHRAIVGLFKGLPVGEIRTLVDQTFVPIQKDRFD